MPSRHFLRSDYLHIFFYIKFLVFVSLVHQIRIYKLEYPIRAVSTYLAQSRPSRIAHTTSDCPRCISPAVKTLSTFVLKCPASVFTFVRSVRSKPKAFVTYGWLPKKIKVVISAVTIETIAEANELLGKYDTDFDVIQATVGRGRKIGSYHIMDTNNPVMIFTAHI